MAWPLPPLPLPAQLPPHLLLAPVVLLAGGLLMARMLRRTIESSKLACLVTYDPNSSTWRRVLAYEIGPGIYATRDGDVIAFVPTWAKPDDFVFGKERYRCYPVIRMGAIWAWGPVTDVFLATMDERKGGGSIASVVSALVEEGRVEARYRVTPDLDIAVHIDGARLGERLADLYGRTIEEAIIDVATLAGRLRDFKEYVRTLVELERTRTRSRVLMLLIGFVAVMLLVAMITQLLGGG